jgi:hypothetical protein
VSNIRIAVIFDIPEDSLLATADDPVKLLRNALELDYDIIAAWEAMS